MKILSADAPATPAAAARLLLDLHLTPVLADLICAAVDLDVPSLDLAGSERVSRTVGLRPRPGFAEEVLRAYAYQCAMCGFDGALGHYPVAIEAAHVRWHSQQGPDEITNALALCALHHALFDLGVLGITALPSRYGPAWIQSSRPCGTPARWPRTARCRPRWPPA